jgi:hypothetical protein
MDEFSFEGVEEALYGGIIAAICGAAHRRRRADRGEMVDIGAGCVLRTPVGVADEAGRSSLPLRGHHQGRQRQLGTHVVAHSPADDLSGCQVESTAARYSQPSPVAMQVMSASQIRFGVVAKERCASRFGASSK